MRTTSKLVPLGLAAVLLVGVAAMLVIQQQALDRLRQQNGLLQQQVNGLIALIDGKDRVARLIAAREAIADAPLAREQLSELLRLSQRVYDEAVRKVEAAQDGAVLERML